MWYIDAAKPSYQEEHGRKHKTPWTDLFIDEVKRGLVACKVFVFFPIYWLVYSQMLNNLVSQGMYAMSFFFFFLFFFSSNLSPLIFFLFFFLKPKLNQKPTLALFFFFLTKK